MANFLGVSTFNRGIANYLHAYSLSNANQDNLWSFLTAVGQVLYLLKRLQNQRTLVLSLQEDGTLVGKTVKEVMDTWTVQMGYPVVTINRQEKATTIYSEVSLYKNFAGAMMDQKQPLRNKKGGEK